MGDRSRKALGIVLGIAAGLSVFFFVIADIPRLTYECVDFAERPRWYLFGLAAFIVLGFAAIRLDPKAGYAVVGATAFALLWAGYVVTSVVPELIHAARECGPLS